MNLRCKVSNWLKQMGVPVHIKGYQYLRRAIELCIEDEKMLEGVTRVLYPTVAKEYSTTSSRVERAIRHAIEVACDRGDINMYNIYFGNTISATKGKPTNREFIATIVDIIQLELEEN